jgi:hypothetical protein
MHASTMSDLRIWVDLLFLLKGVLFHVGSGRALPGTLFKRELHAPGCPLVFL